MSELFVCTVYEYCDPGNHYISFKIEHPNYTKNTPELKITDNQIIITKLNKNGSVKRRLNVSQSDINLNVIEHLVSHRSFLDKYNLIPFNGSFINKLSIEYTDIFNTIKQCISNVSQLQLDQFDEDVD